MPGRTKPRNRYFLRAERFFNVAQFVDSDGELSPDLSLHGDVRLHEQSHGQSFPALASNRFGPEAIYLLDEPEAALSATGAIALLATMVQAARAGAQFIVDDAFADAAGLPGRAGLRAGRGRVHRDPVRPARGGARDPRVLEAPERYPERRWRSSVAR